MQINTERMSSTTNEVDKELRLLKGFADSNLRNGSFVFEKVLDLISQATRENTRHIASLQGTTKESSDSIAVVLRINVPHVRELKTVRVAPDCSLLLLKREIEAITGPGFSAERIQVRRTGKAFGQFDEKTIAQCDIKNNDEVVVECKNLNENLNPKGMDRVVTSGVGYASKFQLITLALHAFMLDEDFVSVVELPNAVPGFAPSLKELPKGTFISTNWNADPNAVTLMYKHKLKPGKQFQLSNVDLGASCMTTLAMRGGETHSRESSYSAYADRQNGAIVLTNAELLKSTLVSGLVDKFLPLRAQPQTAATSTSGSCAMEVTSEPSARASASSNAGTTSAPGRGGVVPAAPLGPQRGYVPGYGASDMDPFAGGVHIGGNVGGLRDPAGGAFGPGSGNQIGPDHPMFFPGAYEDPSGGYGPTGGFGPGGYGSGLPQPRFDPFGPVLGPHTDIGGGGAGNVGVDGRGRGRGRGGPGRGAQYPAGEPNPDHLRPPGWH